MTTSLTQFFSAADYLLALPMLLLTLFALGILLIDLLLPKEWKRVNAFTALVGIAFSAAAVGKLQLAYHVAQRSTWPFTGTGFMGSLLVDPLRHLLLLPVPGRRRHRSPDVDSLPRDRAAKITASSTR